MSNVPSVTYIVSALSRPRSLRCVLASLQVQTDASFDVIVADNTSDDEIASAHQRVTGELEDERFRYIRTAAYADDPRWNCYWSADWLVEHGEVHGEYICLPSDDSYYVPIFQEAMLAKGRGEGLGLVYCEMLYDRRGAGVYRLLNTYPCYGRIDKTGFLVRRDQWIGFVGKRDRPDDSDGVMIDELVKRGVKHGKVEEPLAIHN